MATPHVVGAAAILAQSQPDWSAAELKAVLMGSADPHPDLTAYEQGAGRVDVAQALRQQVFTEPASLSMGRQEWPHDDDEPVSRTLTYHNSGDEDLVLDLTAGLTGPDGEPAPDGAITLDRDRIELSAGGSAEVVVTADTAHDGPDGHYTGRVEATDGSTDGSGLALGTAVAIDKEVESYDLTVSHVDRSGEAPGDYTDFVLGLDGYSELVRWGAGPDEAEYTVRLPAGRYLLVSWISTEDGDDDGQWTLTNLADPGFVHNREHAIELDARDGGAFRLEIPRDDLPGALAGLGWTADTETAAYGFSIFASSFDDLFSAQLGPPESGVGLSGGVTGFWADEEDYDDPEWWPEHELEAYGVHIPTPGAIPSGIDRTMEESEFARVSSRYHAQADDSLGSIAQLGRHEDASSAMTTGFLVALPGRMDWRLNTDPGVVWEEDFEEHIEVGDGEWDAAILLWSGYRRYEAGRTHRARWNQAPFGPGFAGGLGWPGQYPAAGREGDGLWTEVPLYADRHGHPGWVFDVDHATASVYADGELIASEDWFGLYTEVPPGSADHRIEVEAERAGLTPFSSRQQVAWTFRSDTTDEVEPLPLWSVRFQPKVDRTNTVTAGSVHLLPIELQAQPGSDVGRMRRLDVEVSGDGGDSWRRVPVVLFPSGRALAVVDVRRGGEFVSLRAEASDTEGNVVEQTIIDAYRIG